MSRRKMYSRRQFLRGLGGALVALPLLNINRRAAWAETPGAFSPDGFPKRFIVLFRPNGTVPDAFFPTPTEGEDFELSPILQPLAEYKDKLVIPRGLDMLSSSMGPGEPHQKGMGGLLIGRPLQEGDFVGGDGSLAGWGDGISVDQAIADHIGATTPIKSLELGIRADSHGGSEVRTRMIYRDAAQPLPPMNDPRNVYDRLFADMITDEDDMLRRRAQRLSVLDTVQRQMALVQRQAGYDDRQRLESHFEMVRDMERRLQNERLFDGTCLDTPPPPDQNPDHEDTMPEIARLQIDLMVMAMACDITRVGSIQFSNAKNHIRFPWLESLGDGHSLSHAGPSNNEAKDELTARETWMATKVKYLMDRLAQVPEGNGTMLDNTLIFWMNELSRGNIHSQVDMPFLLAGGAGGALRTGRLLQYDGDPHNNLLVSFLNIFGVETETFGDERFCTGPLTGLLG